VRRKRLTAELGLSVLDSTAMVNAGVLDVVLATVEAGRPAAEARNWWLGPLAQAANARGTEAAELPITPAQVARVVALVAQGSLTAGLARQVVDGVLAARASPTRSSRPAGWPSCPTRGALGEAVDAAIAAQPDAADKVRAGKVQAVGALVGAVMKATRGPGRGVGRAPPAARAPGRRGLSPDGRRPPRRAPPSGAAGVRGSQWTVVRPLSRWPCGRGADAIRRAPARSSASSHAIGLGGVRRAPRSRTRSRVLRVRRRLGRLRQRLLPCRWRDVRCRIALSSAPMSSDAHSR
jgi:hypothetical protein